MDHSFQFWRTGYIRTLHYCHFILYNLEPIEYVFTCGTEEQWVCVCVFFQFTHCLRWAVFFLLPSLPNFLSSLSLFNSFSLFFLSSCEKRSRLFALYLWTDLKFDAPRHRERFYLLRGIRPSLPLILVLPCDVMCISKRKGERANEWERKKSDWRVHRVNASTLSKDRNREE